jgi:hypothetical protein
VLEATHARPRLLVAPHPGEPRHDAFWLVGGRLVDWGPLPPSLEELRHRTTLAVSRGRRAGEIGTHVPPEEIDEVRIVACYLASHPELRQLTLDPPPGEAQLRELLEGQLDDLGGDLVAAHDHRSADRDLAAHQA